MLSRDSIPHTFSKIHRQRSKLPITHISCSCNSTGSSASSQRSSSTSSTTHLQQHEAHDPWLNSGKGTLDGVVQEKPLLSYQGLSVGGFAAGMAALLGAVSSTTAAAAEAAASEASMPVNPATYVPGPVEVGWQIWFAAVVSTVPFIIGSYEFGKRILIQRRCQVCAGSGLVQRGRFQRKCPECGGFFPWVSWEMFLSANARPGNGGPLLQPRGQHSVFYTVPPPPDNAATEEQQSSSNNFQMPMPSTQQQVESAEAAVEQKEKARRDAE